MNEWGPAMRAARKRSGIRLKDLSDMSGVELSLICHYERGETEPGIRNLVAMADAMEIGVDEYIGRTVFGTRNRERENEELQFTRNFVHEHGLEFALAESWRRRREETNNKD